MFARESALSPDNHVKPTHRLVNYFFGFIILFCICRNTLMKSLSHTFGFASALFVLSAASSVSAQTVLAASSWVPPTHILTVSQKEWCDQADKATSGRVKCNLLPRAVSAPPGTFDAVRDGLADLSFTVHGYTPGRFITTQMGEFSFLGNSAESVSTAFQRTYDKNPAMAAEHKGVKVIAVFTHGPGIAYNTKRPLTKLDDLSGLKFRVGGGMVNEISRSLGMNVTLKPANEAYELLSSGVMDGTLFPAESIESFKLDKVIKYATQFPGGLYNTSFVFMMNEKKWDAISQQDKDALTKISGEYAARLFGRNWDKQDRRGMAFMQASGVQFTKADAKFVSDVKAKTSELETKWVSDAQAKGLTNAAAVLSSFRGEIAKLEK
jgi:TRAP-type transport system periplasmic protein